MPLVQSPPTAWSATAVVQAPTGSAVSVWLASPGCLTSSETWQWLFSQYGEKLLGASLYGPGTFISVGPKTIVLETITKVAA
jgi:hypothetical protein